MASVDKIYLNKDQYRDFRDWIWKNTFWIILLTWENPCRYIYDINPEAYRTGFEQREYPVTNFPQIIDQFLFVHCRLSYIQKRLKEQYGSMWHCLSPLWVSQLIDDWKAKK